MQDLVCVKHCSSVLSISSPNSHQTHFTDEETDTKKVK